MFESPILTVALIVAITSFFKKQLGLTGWRVLLVAFLVSLIIGLSPVIIAAFPPAAPWLTAFLGVVVLFLTAAGTVDFISEVRNAN